MPARGEARRVAAVLRDLEALGNPFGAPHVAPRPRAVAGTRVGRTAGVAQSSDEDRIADRKSEVAAGRVFERARQGAAKPRPSPTRNARARPPIRVHFGQQPAEGAAVAQHREQARRMRLHEAARELLPHALGRKLRELAGRREHAHQPRGFRRHREPEARGEARDAQYAQRVLDERGRDVAKHAGPKVGLPAVGIDQRALFVARHRIDREIAAGEILGERHVGRGEEFEAAITPAVLPLRARQRVFVARVADRGRRESRARRASCPTRRGSRALRRRRPNRGRPRRVPEARP